MKSATTRIEYYKPTASGRREGWAKTFTSIDRSARGVRAFQGGEYLRIGEQDIPVETLVIEIEPKGSVKNGWESARIYRATIEGLSPLSESYNWREQFPSLLDVAEKALGIKRYPFAEIPDTDLLAECRRRGLI